jgi:hypothetical protein
METQNFIAAESVFETGIAVKKAGGLARNAGYVVSF